MKLLGFDNVLCISPHPDDVELAMFGTIAKYQDTSFAVVVCSMGSKFDPSFGMDRLKEVEKFWAQSGCTNVKIRPVYSCVSNFTEEGWINHCHFSDIKTFQAIFAPSKLDSHFEHRILADVSVALCRANPISLIQYKSFSTIDEWVPNFFVSCSETLEKKIALLQVFGSQKKHPYFSKDVQISAHSHMQSAKRGILAVEQFKIVQLYEP